MTTSPNRFTFALDIENTIKLQRLASIRTAQENRRVLETHLIREMVVAGIQSRWAELLEKEQSADIMKLIRGQ